MTVEESPYKDQFEKKLALASGNFYIFKKYVIGEVHEGVHFNWDVAHQVIEEVYDYFGSRDIRVSYISNRVNAYTIHPQDWIKFYIERNHLEAFAVVAYNKLGFMNVVMERVFTQARLRKFSTLKDAVDWVDSLTPSSSTE